MTTIAEKKENYTLETLERVTRALGGAIDIFADIKDQVETAIELEAKNTNPADPEPLELWTNVYKTGLKAGYESKDKAKQREMAECLRSAVHMREVTPQMEQDAKDAARYRKAKQAVHGSLFLEDGTELEAKFAGEWDQILDKAMEQE